MPELNPRRVASTKGRFAQVSAAVLAGMAAMFCLQNVIEFRRETARPAAPPLAAPAAPGEPEPDISLPLPEGVKRQAGPVPSSMMLKPEEGIKEGGDEVVGVSGEQAPPKFDYTAPPPPEAQKAKKKERVRLKDRTMESRFASRAANTNGRFTEFHRPVPKAEEYVPPAPMAAAPPPKPVTGASGIKLIEKPAAPLENLQPALIAQITVPEVIFWTKQRKINIGVALVVLVLGIIYFVYASGVHDAPPERAEGEL